MAQPFNFTPSGDMEADIAAVAADERIPVRQRNAVIEDMKALAAGQDGATPQKISRRIRTPDGGTLTVHGPASASEEDWNAAARGAIEKYMQAGKPAAAPPAPMEEKPFLDSVRASAPAKMLAGTLRGAGSIGATILTPLDAAARSFGIENEFIGRKDRRQAMDAALTEATGVPDLPDSWWFSGPKLATEIAGTLPIGGLVGKGIGALSKVAPKAAPVIDKVAEGATNFGFRAPGTAAPTGVLPKVWDQAARIAGGATASGATAGAIDPADTGFGVVLGAAAAPVLGLAAAGGRELWGAVKGVLYDPFSSAAKSAKSGRLMLDDLGGDAARVMNNLRAPISEVVPGAKLDAVSLSGSPELASLNRTLQSTHKPHAAALQRDAWEWQNAYNRAIAEQAGSPGKVSALITERNNITGPMREQALNVAGRVDPSPLRGWLKGAIEGDNGTPFYRGAMKDVQQELDELIKNSDDGLVSARGLYNRIRKHVGDLQEGKAAPRNGPQLREGQKAFTRGELNDVKFIIDEIIENAYQANMKKYAPIGRETSTGVGPYTAGIEAGQAGTSGVPLGDLTNQRSWRNYLAEHAKRSKEIDSLNTMQDVWRRIKGVDLVHGSTQDEAEVAAKMLSRAKLANILEKEGADLGKTLTPTQMQTLQNVLTDMQARHASLFAGKTNAGSNTVQNKSAADALDWAIVRHLAQSNSAIGREAGAILGVLDRKLHDGVKDAMSLALREPDEMLRQLRAAQNRARTPQPSLNAPGPLTRLTTRAAPLLANRDQ